MLGFPTQAVPDVPRSKSDWKRSKRSKVEAVLASLNEQGLEPRVATSLLSSLRPFDGLKLLDALEDRKEANIFHYNALLNTFSKDSSWNHALAFLEKMNRRQVQKDTISCNAAIRACALAECWEHALGLLEVMQRDSLRSDTISFNSAISGMCGDQWPFALQLFEEMDRSSVAASTVTINSILAFAECAMRHVEELLKTMELQRLEKDVITYSSAVHACGDNWERAIAFLQQMREEDVQINLICRNAVIDVCDKGGAWQVAIQLLRGADVIGFNSAINACGVEWTMAIQLMNEMQIQELQMDVITFNAAISACDEARNWQKSFELFQALQGVRLVPNTRSYAAVIHCCEMERQLWPESLRLLEEMDQRGVEVNTMAYNSAINACEKASEWTWALDLFSSMEPLALDPSVVSFGACAKALEQGGSWLQVLDLLVLMTSKSYPPDVVVSSAAISACAKGHIWLEAIDILEEMLDFHLDIPSIAVSATFSACERRSVPACARTRHFGG